MFHKQNGVYTLIRRTNKIVAISNNLFEKYVPILVKIKMSVIYNVIDTL